MSRISTTSGAKLYIGTTLAIGEGSPPAEYDDDTYVEVGEIENLGEIGDESPLVPFTAIGDARTRKLKGARDAGTMTVVVGRDPLDAGQEAMKDAERTKYDYNFKLEFADAPSEDYSDSVMYFTGKVASQRTQLGANDDVTKVSFQIAVNSDVEETESELLSP